MTSVSFPGGKFEVTDTAAGVVVRQFRRASWQDTLGPGRKHAVMKLVAGATFDEPMHVVLDRCAELARAVRRGEVGA